MTVDAMFAKRPEYKIAGDLPTISHPSWLPRWKHWYPLEDRFTEKHSVDKSLIGKYVKISRVIVRTGYIIEPTDFEEYQIKKTVDEIMRSELRNAIARAGAVEDDLLDDAVRKLYEFWGYGIRNRAIHRARGLWMAEMYALPEYKQYHRMRTFWYVNIKDVNPEEHKWLRITHVKHHVLGRQYPAESYSYSGPDGTECDYTPGGLSPCYYQSVYLAGDHKVWARNYDDYSDRVVEIHPLDILEVSDDKKY